MNLNDLVDSLKQAGRERLEGMGEAVGAGLLTAVKGAPTPTLEASAKPAVEPTAAQDPMARPAWFWPLIAALAVLVLGGLFWFVGR